MKKCAINGDRGIYSKKNHMIITFGRSVKFYDEDTFELLFRTKGIRYISDICFNEPETVLWVSTTQNDIYAIDIKNFETICQFRVKSAGSRRKFEIDGISVSGNEKYLYFTAGGPGERLICACDLSEEKTLFLNAEEFWLPMKTCFARDALTCFRWDSYHKESWLLRMYEQQDYALPGSQRFRVKKMELNTWKQKRFNEIICVSDDGKYLLCANTLVRKGKRETVIIDINSQQPLEGEVIPFSAERGRYDAERQLFILFTRFGAAAAFIRENRVSWKHLHFAGKNDRIEDCVIAGDKIVIVKSGGSSLAVELSEIE